MADPWELILFHTYTGTPGVISDQSPARGSHGVAVNLADNDFRADGISTGSGAVAFHPNSSIHVTASKSWQPLTALRGEVVCIGESSTAQNTLIDGGSFRFYTQGPHLCASFSASPGQNSHIDTHANPIVPNFKLPNGHWKTVGFLHDGASMMELYLDGRTVARAHEPLWPINSANSISIGNNHPSSSAMDGLIDDVKVWRVNPHRVDEEFLRRPMDSGVAQCWARWGRALAEVLNENRQCARHLRELISRAAASVVRDGLNHDEATRQRLREAQDSYRQLWSDGNLGDIAPVLADLISWLQRSGLDPADNADVIALLNDNCLQTIHEKVPPMDCDPQFTDLLRSTPRSVEHRDQHRRFPSAD